MTMLRARSGRSSAPRRVRIVALFAVVALFALPAYPLRAQDTASRAKPARVITLDEAIRLALDSSSAVRLARSTASLDSLTVRQFRNQFLPNLSASAQSSQGFASGSAGTNALSTSVGLSGGVTLYNGSQNVNALREAELNAHASGQDLARTRQTIVFVVASEFLALITQQELLRVQQENLAAQQDQLRQLEAFTKAGRSNIGDLYQQQSATAAARLAVANASRTTELAKVDLIQELVLDPRRSYAFEAPPADSSQRPNFNLDSLVSIALLQRVDIQAQAMRVQAAEREILVADGGRLPVVSASIGYGSAATTPSAASFASQLDQRRGGSVGVGVALPIFDRGAVAIARQRARIQLENATLAMRDQVQLAALDVRRAYLNYQSAREQLDAADAQQKAAALALEAMQTRYRVGLATFVEVTLARDPCSGAERGGDRAFEPRVPAGVDVVLHGRAGRVRRGKPAGTPLSVALRKSPTAALTRLCQTRSHV
jgi:outer membrane protein